MISCGGVGGTQRALPQAHDQRTFWNHSSSPGGPAILRFGPTGGAGKGNRVKRLASTLLGVTGIAAATLAALIVILYLKLKDSYLTEAQA
jgi:hypothetical protein